MNTQTCPKPIAKLDHDGSRSVVPCTLSPGHDGVCRYAAAADTTDGYDPWADLGRRKGVDIQWHTGRQGRWERPLGVTTFSKLSISLLVGQSEHKLRSALAHELVHLERGPVPTKKTSYEERRVSVLAAQRLIDPGVFADIMTATSGDPDCETVRKACRVDWHTFVAYARWRATVQPRTVHRVWDSRFEPIVWPPKWVLQDPSRLHLAARILGSR